MSSHLIKLRNNFIKSKGINILFCDIQKKFKPIFYEDLIHTAELMAEASKILKFNQIVTEHKKEVFGETVPEILKHTDNKGNNKSILLQKTRFPMLDNKLIDEYEKDDIFILLGVETHICILQTTLALLNKGRDVIILADGVSSASMGDRNVALKNLYNLGAYITTSQSLLFFLLGDDLHPKFKSLLPIFKKMSARQNNLNSLEAMY
jgi:hypothetical protein